MGCSRSKVAGYVEDQVITTATKEVVPENSDEVVISTLLEEKVDSLRRQSEQLQTMVASLEQKLLTAAKKFEENEHCLDNIEIRLEGLASKSKSIKKVDWNLGSSRSKQKNPWDFENQVGSSVKILGEIDQNSAFPTD